MESWRKFKLQEESQPDQNKHLLAACAVFANKYIKGREQQQLPVTIILSSAEEVDDHFSGGKETKGKKVKRGKSGSIHSHKVVISHRPSGRKVKSTKRSFMTKQNKMNIMINALSSMLLLAKNSGPDPRKYSGKGSPASQYYKIITDIANKLKSANPQQVHKLASIGSETEVAGDSHVDSRFSTRQHSIKKTSGEQTQNFGGSKTSGNKLVTTVEYLVGPLATKSPGDFAGLAQQAKSEHERLAAHFGQEGTLGQIDQGLASTKVGSESPGEFDRRMKKATGLD